MDNLQLKKIIRLLKQWLDGVLTTVQSYLNKKYPPQLTSDSDMGKLLKQQISEELSSKLPNEIKSALRPELETKLQNLAKKSEEKLMLKISTSLENYEYKMYEEISQSPEESENILDDITQADVDKEIKIGESVSDNSPSKENTFAQHPTMFKALLDNSAIQSDFATREDDFLKMTTAELAVLLVNYIKRYLSPKLYNVIDDIFQQYSQENMKIYMPQIGETYKANSHQVQQLAEDLLLDKAILSKIIRPGIIVDNSVVAKALVEVRN